MFISRKTAVWIAGAALALAIPFFTGLAQDTPDQAPAAGGRGGRGGGRGGSGGGGGRGGGGGADYNVSLRTAESKALPNPYARNETFFKLPPDRILGSTSGIATDKDGKSIWVALRCEAQSASEKSPCRLSNLTPMLKFDETG